jgi:hypothetical protein
MSIASDAHVPHIGQLMHKSWHKKIQSFIGFDPVELKDHMSEDNP